MPKIDENEECNRWTPEYGNASRPGLLTHGTKESDKLDDSTTNKADYKWPKYEVGPYARKKMLLKKCLFQEIARRHYNEAEKEDIHVMEKDTTYKSQYQGGSYQPLDIIDTADPEVIAKYPLYTDQAHSVYFDKLKNYKSTLVSYDPQAAFRKCSFFSKPFYAELE